MFSQMTIGKKIYLGFGSALGVALIVAGVAYSTIGDMGNTIDRLVHVNARKQLLVGQMEWETANLLAQERGIALRALLKEFSMVEQYNRDFAIHYANLTKDIEEIRPLLETDQARRDIQALGEALETIVGLHQELYKLALSGNTQGAAILLKEKMVPVLSRAGQSAHSVLVMQSELMAKVVKSTEEQVASGRRLTLGMIGLCLLVGIVSVLVVRQITSSLRRTAHELGEGASQVASAASQVAATSQSVAQGASEQAASLQETSSASEEIRAMSRESAEKTVAAADLVNQSQQKFGETNRKLEQMVTAMNDINTSSSKISKIIKVIDEIAFQTNILALNAAVEAARAGEAGMGFAVVADEVRNLAQRCAQAAGDTAALIEESIAKSNDGKLKVDEVATAIRNITEESAKVKTLVEAVTGGAQAQTRGIEQVAKAVLQMEQLTQSSAASAEESAAAAEELTAQSQAMKSAVDRLGAMVGTADRVRSSRT